MTDSRPAAVYVDFESLQGPASSPALLGVLIDDGRKERFEQIVLDPRLYPAIVAKPHVRTGTLRDAVDELLALNMPVVGWSSFDREVVATSDIDTTLRSTWTDRYVNALLQARTWRTKVHPSFKIVKADAYAAKHTLDRYAELAGYPGVAQLRNAAPARWIRHVLRQLSAVKHYRRVTRQTKRDWHRLLDYNRHDCFALRHVYLKAAAELAAWRAYETATYCVTDAPARPVCFRVGSRSARLDALLASYGSDRWAFLTAWNPASVPLSRAENDRRQNELIAALTAAGHRCLPGEGRSPDGSWPPEESVLALDIPERDARGAGREYGQLAILTGHRGFQARLVACS
jgi:hypothetical protein